MSAAEELTLPGTPGPTLAVIWEALSPQERAALRAHLLGDTSAEWLAATLTKFEHRISASSIRTYRRSLKGVC